MIDFTLDLIRSEIKSLTPEEGKQILVDACRHAQLPDDDPSLSERERALRKAAKEHAKVVRESKPFVMPVLK